MSLHGPGRILFVVPTLKAAGAERQVVDLACGLDSRHFESGVYFYEHPDSLKSQLDAAGIPVHFRPKRNRFDLKLARDLAHHIEVNGVQLVHCTLQNALLFGWLARHLVNGPKPRLVAALHTTINVDVTNELVDRWINRRLLRSTDDIWFVCMNQARHWHEKFPELQSQSRVIYNGVDTGYFFRESVAREAEEFRRRFDLDSGGPVIACVAGFRPEKRHDLLLAAFGRVLQGFPEARLVLAGDGPDRDTILHQASALGIDQEVRLVGVLDDVRPLLAISSCKVLASTAVETFSMAVLEALSMEVPVVATDIGGASEMVIPGETGFLAAPGQVDDLVAGILAVLECEGDEGMGHAGRQLVQARFTTEAMVAAATEAMTGLMSTGMGGHRE